MLTWRAILAIVVRPSLWIEAVRSLAALSSPPWWNLTPDGDYVAWRTATAYGSPDVAIAADDLVAYLRWRRKQRS